MPKGRAGLFFPATSALNPLEPAVKRTAVFVDGQNLFHAAREAFGHRHPNYDVRALAIRLCQWRAWRLVQTRFYTGVPTRADNLGWHRFWEAKLRAISRQGVQVYTRPLRFRRRTVKLPDGTVYGFRTGEEKGIDVRIALDIVRMAHRGEYDVGLVLSQDQDLSEAADEICVIASEQNRWIKLACAFPLSRTSPNRRGIDKTDWISIDRATYDSCLDRRDYR